MGILWRIIFSVLVCASVLAGSVDVALAGGSIVLTQLPLGGTAERNGATSGGMLRADYGDGGRIVSVSAEGAITVLSNGFASACEADVSFDGKRILFAGKKKTGDSWDIFEMGVDGSGARQVTNLVMDCRSPGYQARFYTIVSTEPWYQMTFVGARDGYLNESGEGRLSNLYSCRLDGTGLRQLSYNLSSSFDPFIMADGRIVYAGWQRATLDRGVEGRVALFGMNTDGTDNAAFSTDEGKRVKQMVCGTTDGLAVFVEGERTRWDGAGSLGSVRSRRPLHSYRAITGEGDGLFHSPSPLADGKILVSRRSGEANDNHGVYRMDPASGKHELVFDDPGWHDIGAKAVGVREEPDGRSSVVTEKDDFGKLYCLNVYNNDLGDVEWMAKGAVKKVRVVEGIGLRVDPKTGKAERHGMTTMAQRRILGETEVYADGSFNLEIPANVAVQLQVLDDKGMALRSCSWVWVKNHESRGCIGCHEDGELSPENVVAEAIKHPSVKLGAKARERRTVDFRRDVMEIVKRKCAGCHGESNPRLNLSSDKAYQNLMQGGFVEPGRARASGLMWHIFGENTSRQWDSTWGDGRKVVRMPKGDASELTEGEKRTIIEWIDMQALWNGIAGTE